MMDLAGERSEKERGRGLKGPSVHRQETPWVHVSCSMSHVEIEGEMGAPRHRDEGYCVKSNIVRGAKKSPPIQREPFW